MTNGQIWGRVMAWGPWRRVLNCWKRNSCHGPSSEACLSLAGTWCPCAFLEPRSSYCMTVVGGGAPLACPTPGWNRQSPLAGSLDPEAIACHPSSPRERWGLYTLPKGPRQIADLCDCHHRGQLIPTHLVASLTLSRASNSHQVSSVPRKGTLPSPSSDQSCPGSPVSLVTPSVPVTPVHVVFRKGCWPPGAVVSPGSQPLTLGQLMNFSGSFQLGSKRNCFFRGESFCDKIPEASVA